MIFFVPWTKGDPVFQSYDSNSNVLVSPSNVPLSWSVKKWKTLPQKLFIDSGAFSVRSAKISTVEKVLERQVFMAKGWPSSRKLYFSHPDILIPIKTNFKKFNQIIVQSIERAKAYFGLFSKRKMNASPVGVIHGFDEEAILNTHEILLRIGYRNFALGSLGIRNMRYKDLCMNAIRIAEKFEIKPLHLFGITLPMNSNLSLGWIDSFDSSSPIKLAFYGTVLYGSPLKRYVIAPNAIQKQHDISFKFRKSIPAPLPCKCPICRINPEGLIPYSGYESKKNRIIHNYFQIKWEIEKII
jgi:7-cyano-7-deazaguanine tRNA-ribosyltransferase